MHLFSASLSASLRCLAVLLFALATLLITPAYGAMPASHTPDGALDAAAVAANPDPAGYSMTLGPNGEPRFVPAALPGDEHWDDRFGTPGAYEASIYALAEAPNGDLLVGGWFTQGLPGVEASSIVRWDGNRWHALGAGVSGAGENVRGIVADETFVYIFGSFTNAGGVNAQQLARWDGQAWSALGSGVGPRLLSGSGFSEGTIYAAAVAPNGDLYVGGYFSHIDALEAHGVARWDGQQWHALDEGVGDLGAFEGDERTDAWVYALAADADGSIYVGGKFEVAGTLTAHSIARWDGQSWSALGQGLTVENQFEPWGDVRALAVGNGQLYAGGQFSQAGGLAANNIAVWNGSAWAALGAGMSAEFAFDPPVATLLLDGTTLYAGGEFTSAGGTSIAGLAQWQNGQWSPVGTGADVLNDDSGLDVQALARTPAGVFAAGNMQYAGERFVFDIARWDGQAWDSLGDGAATYGNSPSAIRSVSVDGAGRVYVGGTINQVGGIPVSHVAMWDGTSWHDLSGGISGGDKLVYAVLALGDELYVGGSFSQAGNVAASNIAKWNRTTGQWSALGAGTDRTVRALAFGDGLLFAGGEFNQAGGSEAKDVAYWDGANWSGLGGDYEIFEIFDSGAEAGTYVNALAYAGGRIYAGGHFQTVHEKGASSANLASYVVVHNLISYDLAAASWQFLGTPALPGVTTDGRSGFGTDVYALAVAGNGLFVGGTFNGAGGVQARNLARYDLGANSWSVPGGTGGIRDEVVRGLAVYGNDLFVAGGFTTIGTAAARYIAHYNTATGQWATLGSGLSWYNDEFTTAFAVAAAPEGVYVGGEFDYAGPHPSLGFAHWSGPLTLPGDIPEDQIYSALLPLVVR